MRLLFHPDGSLNFADRLAASGDIVTFYATGVGLNSPVTATVGGTGATVLYAGDAPGLPGITQINLQVPAGPLLRTAAAEYPGRRRS